MRKTLQVYQRHEREPAPTQQCLRACVNIIPGHFQCGHSTVPPYFHKTFPISFVSPVKRLRRRCGHIRKKSGLRFSSRLLPLFICGMENMVVVRNHFIAVTFWPAPVPGVNKSKHTLNTPSPSWNSDKFILYCACSRFYRSSCVGISQSQTHRKTPKDAQILFCELRWTRAFILACKLCVFPRLRCVVLLFLWVAQGICRWEGASKKWKLWKICKECQTI